MKNIIIVPIQPTACEYMRREYLVLLNWNGLQTKVSKQFLNGFCV